MQRGLTGGLPVAGFATTRANEAKCHGVHQVVQIAPKGKAIMKITKLAMLVLTIAVALFILIPSLSWADDGATLYKTKCAACHGADGAGKPAAKIPSLISDEAKKMSDADLSKAVTDKPKHAGVAKALTPDQIKMVIGYIRSVQK
jgi:cytochrome c553